MGGLRNFEFRIWNSELRIHTIILAALLAAGACSHKDAPKRYPLQGQILGVNPAKQEITIKHGDIPGFMPAMTMIYFAGTPDVMKGREPGEMVTAVLEVKDSFGKLVEITHVGSAPLPADSNEVAMASGVLDMGDPVPDAALIDQANHRRSLSEWTGTPAVLTFIYTRCPLPDFCPLTNQNVATLQRRLADETVLHGRVKLITVTIDPAHDTPAVLAALAAKLKADLAVWTFLTGDVVTVERFAGKFGVAIIRDPNDASQITHNLRTTIIGADGRVAKIYSGNDWTPGAVLTDLRGLVEKNK